MLDNPHLPITRSKTVDVFVDPGERRMVGGQEDMSIDVAVDLQRQQDPDAHRDRVDID
ncbi:hypothetical protein [Caballeronia insecticola]